MEDDFVLGNTLLVAVDFTHRLLKKEQKIWRDLQLACALTSKTRIHPMKKNTVCSFQISPSFLNPLSPWRSLCWIAFVLTTLALSPASRGADGDLGNGNTAEGLNALASLNGGFNNTALGNGALFRNTNGGSNTATGTAALNSNVSGFSNTAD